MGVPMAEALPDWAPEGVDPSAVSVARVYDYYLGGTYNFDVDRQVARHVLQLVPEIQEIVQANRAFLHRAVRYLVGRGIRQFIDLGSGIPSVGNVHETAQQAAPGCRVLYVDHDPTAVAQSAHLLRHNLDARIQQGDLLDPESVLAAADFIDFFRAGRAVDGVGPALLRRPRAAAGRDRPVPGTAGSGQPPGRHSCQQRRQPSGAGPDQPGVRRLGQPDHAAHPGADRRAAERLGRVAPGAVWVPQWHPDEPVGEIDLRPPA